MGILLSYIVLILVNIVVVRLILCFIKIGWVNVVMKSMVNVKFVLIIVFSVKNGNKFFKLFLI